MKLYIVLFTVLVASASAGKGGKSKEQRMAEMKDCVQESGLSFEEFKKSVHEENPSHAVKCTVQCMCRKMGLLTDDGNVDISKVLKKFGKDEEKAAAIRQCDESSKGQSDKCDRVFAFKKCAMKAAGFGKGGKGKSPSGDEDNDNV